MTAVKRCPRCGLVKAAEAFYRRRHGRRLSSYCQLCTRAASHEGRRRRRQDPATAVQLRVVDRPATVETALGELAASGVAAPDGAGPARRWSPLAPSGDPLLDAVDLRGAHDFRHTFATWLEDAGLPARVIDELMGHEASTRGVQHLGSTMGATTATRPRRWPPGSSWPPRIAWWLSSASLSRWWRPSQPGCHVMCSDNYGRRFLANLWQMAVRGSLSMQEAGCWTRPHLVVGVEPPAGIEPATPSLPWNHREPLCEPAFSQVALDRKGRSYRFSLGEGMRSLPITAICDTDEPSPTSVTKLSQLSILVRSGRAAREGRPGRGLPQPHDPPACPVQVTRRSRQDG